MVRRLATILALAVGVASARGAGEGLSMQELGAWPAEFRAVTISEDGRHAAVVVNRGEKMVVERDGSVDGECEEVGSRGGTGRIAHWRETGLTSSYMGNGLCFSPDGKRLAYAARTGEKKWTVMVDGKAGLTHDGVMSLSFSKDSKRVVYVALGGKTGEQQAAVVDGRAGPFGDAIEDVAVSGDGKHVVYTLKNGSTMIGVADGKPSGDFSVIMGLTYSSDSKRLAYIGMTRGFASVVVLDDRRSAEYASVEKLEFSPDSQHVAYVASTERAPDRSYVLVVDGKTTRLKAGVSELVYSGDSKRLGLVTVREKDNRQRLIVDGKEVLSGAQVWMLKFSPDSKRWACVVKKPTGCQIVVDGVEQGEHYESIRWLRFSPDSKRVSYVGMMDQDKRMTVVVDGAEQGTYDRATPAEFSPDSAHVSFVVKKDQEEFVVTDGKLSAAYDRIGTSATWDNSGFAAGRGYVKYSPDSKHWLAWGSKGKKWLLLVDGKERAEFDRVAGMDAAPLVFDANGAVQAVAVKEGKLYRWRMADF